MKLGATLLALLLAAPAAAQQGFGAWYFETPARTGPAAPSSGYVRMYTDASGRQCFKGHAGFAACFDLSLLTGAHNYSLPDADGTLGFGSGSGDITDVNIATTSGQLTGGASCASGACSFTLGLATAGAGAGSCTNCSATLDAYGRVTAYSSGSAGGVTNVATTSPITGGPITTTGTIACATCTTSAAVLTANQLVIGAGSQAEATLGSLGTTTTVLHGNAGGAPTFGAVANADLTNSTVTVTAGTALSGGGSVALGSSVTLNHAAVGSAGSCGSGTKSCVITFDAQGHETSRSETTITNGAVDVTATLANYVGDGTTTVFTLPSTAASNGVYSVDIGGAVQGSTADYSCTTTACTFVSAPGNGINVHVRYYTSTPLNATSNAVESFTCSGGTDFTLAHSPIAGGVTNVSEGIALSSTEWSLVGSTTLRLTTACPSPIVVVASYLY